MVFEETKRKRSKLGKSWTNDAEDPISSRGGKGTQYNAVNVVRTYVHLQVALKTIIYSFTHPAKAVLVSEGSELMVHSKETFPQAYL